MPQQGRPVGVALGPAANALEVVGPVGELIRPPGEQEDVLGGAQLQDVAVDLRRAGRRRRRVRLLDLAAEVGADLVGRDLLQPGLDHGVAGGNGFGLGTRHGCLLADFPVVV